MVRLKNFIAGQFVEATSGKFLTKLNPATGETLYEFPDSNELDVVKAVQTAYKAQEEWAAIPLEARSRSLLRLADLVEAMADEFARYESEDVGMPLELARSTVVPAAIQNLRFYATRAVHAQNLATDTDGKILSYTLREPVGVVASITSWSLPFQLLTARMAAAVMSGNAVICKPSELASRSAYEFAQLINEAQIPPGVCNIILGRGEVVGKTLASHPGIRAVAFAGSSETGEKIAKAAASGFKRTNLQMGGKNAAIVVKDCDLKRAVLGTIRSSFLAQGQLPWTTSRIFIQDTIYDEFVEMFVKEVNELGIGDPQEKSTFIGPLISKWHTEKVGRGLESAIKEGARLLTSEGDLHLTARVKNGYFLRPAVLSDLTNCSDLHQTELSGPVVTVQAFKYPHEAVKWANSTPFGLAATIWTQDVTKAHRLVQGLKVGQVWVNSWMQRDPRLPVGGIKTSGLGREGGDALLDLFSELKTISVNL